MTTSATPEGQGPSAVCTPYSFVKGLYLLTKAFVRDSALPLAPVALLILLLTVSRIPAVSNYRMGVDDFAWASVVTLVLIGVSGTLAYFQEQRRYWLLPATMFLVLIHMLSAVMTTEVAPTHVFYGTWWRTAPLLFKAAVLPMYVTLHLLLVVVAGGAVVFAVRALVKLPKAMRAAARHICKTGQGD